jgi:DNA polymerase-3 subunit alpha
MTAKFIHLRVHSSYSLSEGAILPDKIAGLCDKKNFPAVGITDTGNLFGALEISSYCSKYGVQAIIGCEVNLQENPNDESGKLILLAQTDFGYRNLLKIVSNSFLLGNDHLKPTISLEHLQQNHADIICLTGGHNGVINRYLKNSQKEYAVKLIEKLHKIFGTKLCIELNRLGYEGEQKIEEQLIEAAYSLNIPLVATNNVMFATPEMHSAQDALMCIAAGTFVNDANRVRFTQEHYFKSEAEMCELFADIPEALENTINIAKRCSYSPKEHAPTLPSYPTDEGRTEEDELFFDSVKGLCERLEFSTDKQNEIAKNLLAAKQNSSAESNLIDTEILKLPEDKQKYFTRVVFELKVISNMKFPGYFLIVSDFIKWAKSQNIPVGPGRGSGAGSVVAWALQITNLDPLRFGLLFERFLNPERVSMPDFDIDFCQERRGEVISYVQKKYGVEKFAQIITFGKLQARAVLRDVGRVMQLPYSQVDRICKMVPFNPIDPVTLEKAINLDPELQKARDSDEVVANLLDIGLKLEGMHRHASTHAAGVVIGWRPLIEILPLYTDHRSEIPITQFSMKYCEAAGLVKFDFLGLKTLTIIDKACQMIRTRGEQIDIDKIPLDDKKAFKLLASGAGVGVFQLESAGMRDSMRKMRVDSIEDIIALISLYRPGPMENIPRYIACKLGKEKPDYLHPKLEGTLKETYGVIIYQEQVMQVAQVLAGYSLGAADLLRRAMGKKIKAEMDAQQEMFVSGAVAQGVDKDKASEIFELVAKFAGYGFNKSHAAAYAVIGYQTAYLKAHYPAEFLCASMNLDIGDTDKLLVFKEEAKKCGIEILPPSINHSNALFKVEYNNTDGTEREKPAIRYALGALKGVGVEAILELQNRRSEAQEKEKSGFKNLSDFSERAGGKILNKRMLESLAKCGAFDEIAPNRKQIHDDVASIIRYGQTVAEEQNTNQESLFGGFEETQKFELKLKPTDDYEKQERLDKEFEAIGFYLNNHPVSEYIELLEKNDFAFAGELDETIPMSQTKTEHGGYKKTVGVGRKVVGVVNRVVHRTSNGRRFSYIYLSDPSGMMEVNFFDEKLINEARDLIEGKQPIVIDVEARRDEGGIRLLAQNVELLKDYIADARISVKITLNAATTDKNLLKKLTNLQTQSDIKNCNLQINVITNDNMSVAINLGKENGFDYSLIKSFCRAEKLEAIG